MRSSQVEPERWNALARGMSEPQFQAQIALYKRRENLELVRSWAPPHARTLLKTDLFEEGFGQDALLDVLGRWYPTAVGMDVSHVVAAAARTRRLGTAWLASDACALPFKAESFDLIVSISTLDHLPPPLLAGALAELCRVLRPAGCLVLTLDSRHNPLHVLSNELRRRLGRIHAERCYTVGEVRVALRGQPVIVTETTAVYHVPFPANFLAKQLHRVAGAAADPWIRGFATACGRLSALPTRFLTGRYIALRVVKTGVASAANGAR